MIKILKRFVEFLKNDFFTVLLFAFIFGAIIFVLLVVYRGAE